MLYQNPSANIDDILYEYDPNGNRTKMTRASVALPLRGGVTGASYDEANEMLTFTPAGTSAKDLTYDENGNLLTMTDSCGTTTYTWDVRNRLVGINGFKPDCSALSASFEYDAIGRRIEKTVNGATTQYLYDGMDIIQEIQGGSVTANYVRTLNIDEPLARIQADGTVRYYQTDALGSVIALADENGNVMTTYTYDPFGDVTVSGEASDNPFQYTGRENDGVGLYYYRARYYSAELQRFISEDPIGLAGGDVNLYAYVKNRPTMYLDPMGLEPLLPAPPPPGPPGSGCGDEKTDCIVPDLYPEACKAHDKCYSTPGKTQAQCDNQFWIDMFNESGPWPNVVGPTFYWLGVRFWGDDAYKRARWR